jgi:hypothetical protein
MHSGNALDTSADASKKSAALTTLTAYPIAIITAPGNNTLPAAEWFPFGARNVILVQSTQVVNDLNLMFSIHLPWRAAILPCAARNAAR